MVGGSDMQRLVAMLKASFGAIKQDIHSLKSNQELQLNGTHALKEEMDQLKDSFVHKVELKKELVDFDRNNVQALAIQVEEIKRTNDQLVQVLNSRIRDLNKQFDDIEQMRKELASKVKLINSFENGLKMLEKDMNDTFGSMNKRMATEAQIRKLVDDLNGELDTLKDKMVSQRDFDRKIARIEKKL